MAKKQVKRYANNVAVNLEILKLVTNKSDKQSMRDIFAFVASRHADVSPSEASNRWYHHIRHNLAQYEELLASQDQAAAGAELSLVVNNTGKGGEGVLIRHQIPPKAQLVAGESNLPIQVKMAQTVASNFQAIYERNQVLEQENKHLKESLAGSVSKEAYDGVKRQLRTATQDKIEAETLLAGIVKFKENRQYTVDRDGNVKFDN